MQPCLVVHESTMHKPEALHSILLGLIARRGVIPYVLDAPLAFAERVVGLSLVRQARKTKDRLTGISRVYKADGGLIGYVMAEADVDETEGIPEAMLTALLPDGWLAGKQIVLHIHGRLRRDESRALGAREADLDASFLTVQVDSKQVPRLYALENGRIGAPPWGTAFLANTHEALLLTSSAPGDATPQPLHVRLDPDAPPSFTLEQAIESLIAFTILHYGVLQLPRLPVTLHHADLIAASAERGVLPTPAGGAAPFWL
jgi:argonaute-like protein implicated in RNA metabolism and viral defense